MRQFLTILALGVGVAAGAVSADACGRGFLQILIFRAYPEAKRVSDAEQLALRTGVLKGERFPGRRRASSSQPRLGRGFNHPRGAATPAIPSRAKSAQGYAPEASRYAQALHAWRVEQIARTLIQLKRRLNASNNTLPNNQKAYILLINEFKWWEIQASETGLVLTERGHSPDAKGIRLFTTRRIVDALLGGSLSLQTAQNKNLITSRGAVDSVTIWFDVLRGAFARQSTVTQTRHAK